MPHGTRSTEVVAAVPEPPVPQRRFLPGLMAAGLGALVIAFIALAITQTGGDGSVQASDDEPATDDAARSAAPSPDTAVTTTNAPADTVTTTTPPTTTTTIAAPTSLPAVDLVAAVQLAAEQLGELEVSSAGAPVPFSDLDYVDEWLDADGDCRNTWNEVMAAESVVTPVFETDRRCRVDTGRWVDPLTGASYLDRAQVGATHLIPLEHAHHAGAWAWNQSARVAFANDLGDPASMTVLARSTTLDRGSDGPEDWRPPDEASWCAYAVDWIGVKVRWGLTITSEEKDALRELLGTCLRGFTNGPDPANEAHVPPVIAPPPSEPPE